MSDKIWTEIYIQEVREPLKLLHLRRATLTNISKSKWLAQGDKFSVYAEPREMRKIQGDISWL